MFYFSGYLFKNSTTDNESISSSDSNISDLADTTLQTKSNLVDKAVETDRNMEHEDLMGKLFEVCAPSRSSLPSDISQTDFIVEYENNPYFKNYIDDMVRWAKIVQDSS
jgi:hypothetical protein